MKRVVRRLLPLLAMVPGALVPGLASAADTNGHKEVEFEKFRVVLDVTAPGARAPTWYVSGTRVAPAYSSAPFYRNAPGPWPHDTIRLASYRFKIAGTEVDAATRPPDTGGSTTGGSTGGDGPLALAAVASGTGATRISSRDSGAFLLPARRPAPAPRPEPAPEPSPEPAQTPAGPASPWLPLPESAHPWNPIPAIRFASTHFADGSPVEMEYECTYDLMNSGVVTGTKTMSVVFTATAYNKLQTLGTNKSTFQSNGSYITDYNYQVASDGTTNYATIYLPTHTADPGSVARSETQYDIVDKITPSTVMVALTHGSATGFDDSDRVSFISFSGPVASNVADKADEGIPPYNFVGFWACDTLSSAPPPAVIGYGISGPDRAYAGFNSLVALWLWDDHDEHPGEIPAPPPNGTATNRLSSHAQVFWFYIGAGYTVSAALDRANLAFMPRKLFGQALPMTFEGDGFTTLKPVYLSQQESAALIGSNVSTTSIWWIKL